MYGMQRIQSCLPLIASQVSLHQLLNWPVPKFSPWNIQMISFFFKKKMEENIRILWLKH